MLAIKRHRIRWDKDQFLRIFGCIGHKRCLRSCLKAGLLMLDNRNIALILPILTSYLLRCYRYIELNPVRASMVQDPSAYPWSSYRCNALGLQSKLITPHETYLGLGKSKVQRLANYRELFKHYLDDNIVKEIRETVNKGLVFGSERFKDKIEFNLKRRVRPEKPGPKSKELLL